MHILTSDLCADKGTFADKKIEKQADAGEARAS